MSFYSPVLRAYTPLYGPPHPDLLWDLSESALANQCLLDHQNNAMFIPEAPTSQLFNESDSLVEPDGSDDCKERAFSPNVELTAGAMEIVGRSNFTTNTDIERKFQAVDQWLEEQIRNTVHARPGNEYLEDQSEEIPHHLFVQLGLANGSPANSGTFKANNYGKNKARNSYESRFVGQQGYNVNSETNGETFRNSYESRFVGEQGYSETNRETYSVSHCDASICSNGVPPVATNRAELESQSSLSQLFRDEELNEECMREISLTIETINQGSKGYFIDGTGHYSNATKLLETKCQGESVPSSDQVAGVLNEMNTAMDAPQHLPVEQTCPEHSYVMKTTQQSIAMNLGEEKSSGSGSNTPGLPIAPLRGTPTRPSEVATPVKLVQSTANSQQSALSGPEPTKLLKTPGKRPQIEIQSPQTGFSEALPTPNSRNVVPKSPTSKSNMSAELKDHGSVTSLVSYSPRLNTCSGELGNPKSMGAAQNPNSEKNSLDILKENDENATDHHTLPAQSSLSQLFQTQEFTVDHYMDMVKFGNPEFASNADALKPADKEVPIKSEENILDATVEVPKTPMNTQQFVIKGHEPKMFDVSVKREEDLLWKKHVTEGVLEPSNEVSKRDQKILEEIPIVVSPYFPNDQNHPVQDDKRASADSPKFSVSQVLNFSRDASSEDVLGKILNYEEATDDYQICKDFFSHSSPPPKSQVSDAKVKMAGEEFKEATSKTKNHRKKEEAGHRKITDYFSVVKKGGIIGKERHKTKVDDRKPKKSKKKLNDHDHSPKKPKTKLNGHDQDSNPFKDSQTMKRSSSKFQFEDLPLGSQMKMSNFFVPQANLLQNSETLAHRRKTCPAASAPTSDKTVDVNDDETRPWTTTPETLAGMEDQNPRSSSGHRLEANYQDTEEFGWIARERPILDTESSNVIHLLEEKVEEVASAMEDSGELLEIGFTICYKQKYSRLNMPSDRNSVHTPCGIMSRVEFVSSKTLFIYQDMNGLEGEDGRSFVMCLLESKCRKVCYEAQAFIMFVLDVLKQQDPKICYDWQLLDPMIAMWLMDPDHPSLNFSTISNELNLRVIKSKSDDWKLAVSRHLSIQSSAMEKLYSRLIEQGLWDVFYRMEIPVLSILAAMELRSIEVDYPRLQGTSKILQKKMSAIEQEAWKLVGRQFQVSSPVQLRKILYEELKLDEIGGISVKTTATSKAKSTDEGTLKSLAGVHPLPRLVLEYRHAHKIKSTYIDGLLPHVVNKRTISTTWEQCSAATGRITSNNPNMQSIPKRDEDMTIAGESFNVRKIFMARPGHIFIAVDFQQIELRTFAHLSQDVKLLTAFKEPVDIFVAVTKMRLGKDDFDSAEREMTKTLMYALLYGAGAQKISELLSVTAETAKRICEDFYRSFPGLKHFRSSILEECRTHKKLHSLSGRRRLFPNVTASSIEQKRYAERQAVNFTIQGSAADICKAAMLRTELALRESGIAASLLLQIHDELLWEIPENLESQAKGEVKANPLPITIQNIFFRISLSNIS